MIKWQPYSLGESNRKTNLKIPVDLIIGYGVGIGGYVPARWAANALSLPPIIAPFSLTLIGSLISLGTRNWNYVIGTASASFGFFILEKLTHRILPSDNN